MRRRMPEVTTRCRGFSPKIVISVCPACPQFIIMRDKIRGVSELAGFSTHWHEYDEMRVSVEHIGDEVARFLGVQCGMQNRVGFSLIIVDSLAVAPACRCKKQRHREPRLTIRCGVVI